MNSDDLVFLFSTDTLDGQFCAEVHKKVLDQLNWCKVHGPIAIKGFKTKQIKTKPIDDKTNIAEEFVNAGFINLRAETDKTSPNSFHQSYFNITGGFKGIIPFATILAFEKGMSLTYLYEESDDLVVIPPPERFPCSYDDLKPKYSLGHIPA